MEIDLTDPPHQNIQKILAAAYGVIEEYGMDNDTMMKANTYYPEFVKKAHELQDKIDEEFLKLKTFLNDEAIFRGYVEHAVIPWVWAWLKIIQKIKPTEIVAILLFKNSKLLTHWNFLCRWSEMPEFVPACYAPK